MPFIGIVLLILLYALSIRYRGFVTMQEYAEALLFKQVFPGIHGDILPKIPATAATLLTGLVIWITACKIKLLHPGTAPVIFLCFPPVWWIGTSVSSIPLMVFLISVAAAGLFIAMREKERRKKIFPVLAGAAGAIGAAAISQSAFFSWTAVCMAILPPLSLTLAVRFEKLDDKKLADKKMNRLAIASAVMLIVATAVLILPSICRFLKIDYPEYLTIFRPGEHAYRPALAMLVPLLWLYLVKETQNSANKLYLICLAAGFVMLALPPTLPWQRLTHTVQPDNIAAASGEFMASDPVIFADKNCTAAMKYVLDVPVKTVYWGSQLPPRELAQEITGTLAEKDAAVITADGMLESFLPQKNYVIFTLSPDCKLFFFIGDKK